MAEEDTGSVVVVVGMGQSPLLHTVAAAVVDVERRGIEHMARVMRVAGTAQCCCCCDRPIPGAAG